MALSGNSLKHEYGVCLGKVRPIISDESHKDFGGLSCK